MAQDNWIKILEGHTGKEKARYEVPSSEILPGETSWNEYKHYYRRDLLPYLNVDCISIADLRGTGRPQDIIIKDRHTRLWAYNDNFELLWTASANLGHFPFFHDSDKDGRDEVYIGYTKFDPDGRLIWTLDSLLGEHADGIYVGDLTLSDGPPGGSQASRHPLTSAPGIPAQENQCPVLKRLSSVRSFCNRLSGCSRRGSGVDVLMPFHRMPCTT